MSERTLPLGHDLVVRVETEDGMRDAGFLRQPVDKRGRVTLLLAVLAAVGGVGAVTEQAEAQPLTYSTAYVQVGASSTDQTDWYATGAQAHLGHMPMPQYTVDNAQVTFWLGIYLNDGDFLQIGELTHGAGCTSNYGYFVQVYQPGNKQIINQLVAPCGQNIPTYGTFTIYATAPNPNTGMCTWLFADPNGNVANLGYATTACDVGQNTPYDVVELSGGPWYPHTADAMGPAGATPALATQHGTNNPYGATLHADAYYDPGTFCPPTNTVGRGFNWVSIGTGMSYGCTSNGAALW